MSPHLLRLFSAINLPGIQSAVQGVGDDVSSLLNTEIAFFGYTLERRLASQFASLPMELFQKERRALLEMLARESGASYRHATLFKKFPYEDPEDLDFLKNWILGAVSRGFDLPEGRIRIAPNGAIIDIAFLNDEPLPEGDDWIPFLTNLSDVEGDGLEEYDEVRHAFQRVTPLRPLFLADRTFLLRQATRLLGRNSSLSEDEKAFLRVDAAEVGSDAVALAISSGQKLFRETLPLAYTMVKDPSAIDGLLSSATDILRIAAYLSDPAADLSLKDPVRFKLTTRHRKKLLRLLENRGPTLGEDMLRHRERWLRLGERLNPGTSDNQARYPNTYEAFRLLRNAPKAIPSFNRTVERGMCQGAIDASLLETMAHRPGEFMRRLDSLLRKAAEPGAVLETLRAVVPQVQTKMLLEMEKYLQHRTTSDAGDRVFIPKGRVNKMQVVADNRPRIALEVLMAACQFISDELKVRFAAQGPMGRVHLDPQLMDVVLPLNKRGDSQGSGSLTKGSRYKLPDSDVIRLFVHWTGDDVDLSALMLDEEFVMVEQVSWTNLRGFSCQHSGDVRHAPEGASEFIDFECSNLMRNRVRYVVASVISYDCGSFNDFPCFTGFMARDSLKSGRKFEPSSVQFKFDVSAPTTSSLPVILDLVERKAVYADIASSSQDFGTVVGSRTKLVAQTKSILELHAKKPTAWDVLFHHVAARGELVDDIQEADIVYMAENLDLEAIMAMTATPASKGVGDLGHNPRPSSGHP